MTHSYEYIKTSKRSFHVFRYVVPSLYSSPDYVSANMPAFLNSKSSHPYKIKPMITTKYKSIITITPRLAQIHKKIAQTPRTNSQQLLTSHVLKITQNHINARHNPIRALRNYNTPKMQVCQTTRDIHYIQQGYKTPQMPKILPKQNAPKIQVNSSGYNSIHNHPQHRRLLTIITPQADQMSSWQLDISNNSIICPE